jgi:hypothetical protein
VRIVVIENLINQNQLQEALESIYCFDYSAKEKNSLAHVLVDLVKKSDLPLKAQWKAIKSWIEKIPDIPHYDHKCSIGCNHTDKGGYSAPSFPPYPFE